MKLLHLIAEWRNRLRGTLALAEDPADGNAWLWAIRARILKFPISRYQATGSLNGDAQGPVHAHVPAAPVTFCRVVSADGPPPRSGEAIGAILEDIRRCNRRDRRWWLLWRSPMRP